MEMKFATNIAPTDDIEDYIDDAPSSPKRSISPTRNDDVGDQLVTGEITAHNLGAQDKKALTKCLMRKNLEFRDKMREIVKDFPTMRTAVGGANFDKTIGEQLFDTMKDCKESFDDDKESLDKDQVVSQLDKYLSAKSGQADAAITEKKAISKAIMPKKNRDGSVQKKVTKKFKKGMGNKNEQSG